MNMKEVEEERTNKIAELKVQGIKDKKLVVLMRGEGGGNEESNRCTFAYFYNPSNLINWFDFYLIDITSIGNGKFDSIRASTEATMDILVSKRSTW